MVTKHKTLYDRVKADREFYQKWWEGMKKDEHVTGVKPQVVQLEKIMVDLHKYELMLYRMR